jgi:hypothetical protein
LAGTVLLLGGLSALLLLYCAFSRNIGIRGVLISAVFFAGIWSVMSGMLLLSSLIPVVRKRLSDLLLATLSLTASMVLAEAVLRLSGIGRTYSESRGVYRSAYVKKEKGVFRTYAPYSEGSLTTLEFNYARKRNNYGFSDADFSADEARMVIQVYGDSFTEGDGAPADSAYPKLLQQKLDSLWPDRFRVQNFGICGSDPGFEFMQFDSIGVRMRPTMAIFLYGSGDMHTDFLTRGGIERFRDGYWQGYPGPDWEWAYASSYLVRPIIRAVLHTSDYRFFLSETQFNRRIEELGPKWNDVFERIMSTGEKNGVIVVFVRRPEHHEIVNNAYEVDFSFFEQRFSMDRRQHFDLLPFYIERSAQGRNVSSLYWPKDGHHNSDGYLVLADGILEVMRMAAPELFDGHGGKDDLMSEPDAGGRDQ